MLENLTEIINQKLEIKINQIERSRRYYNMDWPQVRRIASELVPTIVETVVEIVKHEEKLNEKLIAKLNQFAFKNDPNRDSKRIELYNQGLTKSKIAKQVGLTPWVVSKALKRLSVSGNNN